MHVPPGIIQLAEALAVDDAIDVRDTVRNVDLNRLGKGKRVPFEIQNTDPPKRAVTPGQLDPLYHQARDEEATPVDEETDESGEKPSAFSGTPQASYFPTMANMSTSSSNTPPSAIASSHLSRDLPQQRPSSEVTAQLGGMRLTPQPLLSPALRGTVRGSGHGTPTSGEGHWISSPSPSAVPTGKDPFEASFGQATATPTTP
jgi:serine/threonine-protein phosphatase 4 regulatory subunit 1